MSKEPVLLGWLGVAAAAVGAKYGLKVTPDQVLVAVGAVGTVVSFLVRNKVLPAKTPADLESLITRLESAAEKVAPVAQSPLAQLPTASIFPARVAPVAPEITAALQAAADLPK